VGEGSKLGLFVFPVVPMNSGKEKGMKEEEKKKGGKKKKDANFSREELGGKKKRRKGKREEGGGEKEMHCPSLRLPFPEIEGIAEARKREEKVSNSR